jgi:hypothetical protein
MINPVAYNPVAYNPVAYRRPCGREEGIIFYCSPSIKERARERESERARERESERERESRGQPNQWRERR